MIIRKPYAFLIMNFRKIHIALLLISIYIYIVTLNLDGFVNEFLELGFYNSSIQSISSFLSVFVFIGLIFFIGISTTLIFLLKKKSKPWLVYSLYVVLYGYLFVVFLITINFFSTFSGGGDSTNIRFISDLIFIGSLPQYVVFILLLVRVLGLDLNKFDFRNDKEFLELDNDDREEVEVNIEFDKYALIRLRKKIFRNIGYFYTEHKFISNTIIIVLVIGFTISIYNYFFIVNKIYSEGEVFSNVRYDIVVNNSYVSDKDYSGDVIEQSKKFIILDITIKNKLEKVDVDLGKYYLLYENVVLTHSGGTYSKYFSDIGEDNFGFSLDTNEEERITLIYKVDKDVDVDKVLMYYQDYDEGNSYIRRVNLDVENLGEEKLVDEAVIDEEISVDLVDGEKASFLVDNYSIQQSFDYGYENCTANGDCYINRGILNADIGRQIMRISFGNIDLAGDNLVDFFDKYGTIIYKDINNVEQQFDVVNLVTRDNYSNYLYVDVGEEVVTASEIWLGCTIRGEKYLIKLR